MIAASGLDTLFNIPSQKLIEGEVLKVEESLPTITTSNLPSTETKSPKLEDSTYIEEKLKSLADRLDGALDNVLMFQEEDPTNSFTNASIASLAGEVNKSLTNLINLRKTEKELEMKQVKTETSPQQVTNNVLVMTTEDAIAKVLAKIKG